MIVLMKTFSVLLLFATFFIATTSFWSVVMSFIDKNTREPSTVFPPVAVLCMLSDLLHPKPIPIWFHAVLIATFFIALLEIVAKGVLTNSDIAVSYAHDALGRRSSTTTAEGTVRHVYDGIHCIADLGESNAVLRSYVWGPGVDNLLSVAVADGDGHVRTYYALTDHQSTVHGFADTNGAVVVRYAYDAWGNLLSEDCSVPTLAANRYRFQGREWSAATGLTNFRARWYDPETGRWLSKDPIGLAGELIGNYTEKNGRLGEVAAGMVASGSAGIVNIADKSITEIIKWGNNNHDNTMSIIEQIEETCQSK